MCCFASVICPSNIEKTREEYRIGQAFNEASDIAAAVSDDKSTLSDETDPWGEPYRIAQFAEEPVVVSSGPNQTSPLSGFDDDDIHSGMAISPAVTITRNKQRQLLIALFYSLCCGCSDQLCILLSVSQVPPMAFSKQRLIAYCRPLVMDVVWLNFWCTLMESWLTLFVRLAIVVFVAICVHQLVESTSNRLVSRMFGGAEAEPASETVETPSPRINPWPILAAGMALILAFLSFHFFKFQKFTDTADQITNLGGRIDYQPNASSVYSAYLVSTASVDLSDCDVDEQAPAFKYLPRLKTLRLSGANFQTGLVNEVARCNKLAALDLSSTPITDEDMAALAKLAGLKSLIVNDTKLSDESIDSISQMKSLSHFEGENAQFSESGIQTLESLIPNVRLGTSTAAG